MIEPAAFLKARERGTIRPLARAITLAESTPLAAYRMLADLPVRPEPNHLVGITGPPGVGKSSLVNGLISEIRRRNETVGVLAVDPSSPFSGGSLLGDRIRMNEHAGDSGVYIRSMATRGALGGLAAAAWPAVRFLERWGFDWIVIETAGVGQSEVDVVDLADTTVLVLSPGLGDEIQIMKAGVMEVADLFVVNKADLPGADRTERAIQEILSAHAGDRMESHDEYASSNHAAGAPLVVRTVATAQRTKSGVPQLAEALIRRSGEASPQSTDRRGRRYRFEVKQAVLSLLDGSLHQAIERNAVDRSADGLGEPTGDLDPSGGLDPLADARRIVRELVTDEVWRNIDARAD